MRAAKTWIVLTLACSICGVIGEGDLGSLGGGDSPWHGIDGGAGGSELSEHDYGGGSDYGGGHALAAAADFSSHDSHISVPQKTIVYPKPIPVTVVKKVPVHVPHPVGVPVNYPIQIPVPQPYQVLSNVPHPISVTIYKLVPKEIEKKVPIVVEKPVPYPVEKQVKIEIEKHHPIYVSKPYPVHIPVFKHVYKSQSKWN